MYGEHHAGKLEIREKDHHSQVDKGVRRGYVGGVGFHHKQQSRYRACFRWAKKYILKRIISFQPRKSKKHTIFAEISAH